MCGFSGFVHYGPQTLDRSRRMRILGAMGTALALRGPDDQQFYDDGVLSLVYRRLSIVDRAGGRQPLLSEDERTLLVCNGEIYNHGSLRQGLAARHVFATRSDSEVLLHGYEEWGSTVLERVRGMFALALWDRTEQRLFLARDRLGIKPLYICQLPHGLLFGSELKALLAHPECPRETDWRDLHAHPMALAATPSYVQGINHLPAASYLQLEPGRKPVVQTYWDLAAHFNTAPHGLDARKYIEAFDTLLEEAVEEHLQGEAGMALHLSGGVDSSLIAALAQAHAPDMDAYTIVERSCYLAGDTDAAAHVARSLGIPWHPVLFDYRSYLQDTDFGLHTLEQSVWMMDSPLFDIEWIFKRDLNQRIRLQHPETKVLLLGQGADEFAGGYSTRIDAPYTHWKHYLNEEVRQLLSLGSAHKPAHAGHHSVLLNRRSPPSGASPYQQLMLLMPRQLQHHNLWHEDRSSSYFGMEARVPFLDHRIVELLASVPASLHKKLFWNKHIVRQSLKRRLPSYDVERPKVGFCWTDDSRSLDIIIHGMACRASAAFREQYMEARDFPFERSHCEKLINQVHQRQPGFRSASMELLGLMTATLFHHQVRHANHASPVRSEDAPARGVPTIATLQMAEVAHAFQTQPVTAFDWKPYHRPKVPEGCTIRLQGKTPGRKRYQLQEGSTVHAEMHFPEHLAWIHRLLQELPEHAASPPSVGEWADRLQIPSAALHDVLDAMLQCGFITMPPTESPPRHLQALISYARYQLLPTRWLRRWHGGMRLRHWLNRLHQRRQELQDRLEK